MRDWKKYAAAILTIVAGAVLAWWIWRVPPPPETKRTDDAVQAARADLQGARQRVEELDETTRRKVVEIRERTETEVRNYRPDAVVDALNEAVSGFRGVEGGPRRMDDP